MPVCKHCGTPVKLITPEERPDNPDLWGNWTHAEIYKHCLDASNLSNHGYFFSCQYYLEGCIKLAEPYL
jgi:hypothetical protein